MKSDRAHLHELVIPRAMTERHSLSCFTVSFSVFLQLLYNDDDDDDDDSELALKRFQNEKNLLVKAGCISRGAVDVTFSLPLIRCPSVTSRH